MNMADKNVWGIHTMDDHLFLKENVIAIGWNEIGDLSKIEKSREALKKRVEDVYPDSKKGSIPIIAGMLYRFANEVRPGDIVIFPSKIDRMINIGEVTGEYNYVPDATEYAQQRKVKWLKHLPRTAFSQGALYEAGSAMTFLVLRTMQMNT